MSIIICIFWEVKIIVERKRPLSQYGMRIKVELLNRNKTQKWLMSEIRKLLPRKYIDSSNLYKIMTGEISSPDICKAIDNILCFDTVNSKEQKRK